MDEVDPGWAERYRIVGLKLTRQVLKMYYKYKSRLHEKVDPGQLGMPSQLAFATREKSSTRVNFSHIIAFIRVISGLAHAQCLKSIIFGAIPGWEKSIARFTFSM